MGRAQRRRPRDRRVGDDQAVDAAPKRDADDVVELPVVEVGRDLDEERFSRSALVARLDRPRHERVERVAALQVAQARRVGRGDVDRQVVGQGREGFDAERIVGDPVGGVLVAPTLTPTSPAGRRREPRSRARRSRRC